MRSLTLILLSLSLCAQTPPVARPVRPPAFPSHPPASPETLAQGKALYGVNCNFCHGSDARGGEGGPNLLRSEMVLNDKDGENITGIIQNGRLEQGMPKFPFNAQQISQIAAYIHSFKVGGYDESRMKPLTILVGNAQDGEKAFAAKCASCHSGTGDLKGIGSRITDAKTMQNTWIMPGGGGRGPRPGGGGAVTHVPPVTVTVTSRSGEKAEGQLGRIDDFFVTLIAADGTQKTFRQEEGVKVEVHDPLQPHKELLPTYNDTEIHNLTAYLVTLK